MPHDESLPLPEKRLRSAEQKQEDIRAQAEAMGVDEAYISTLVDTFYGRVQENALLGPIFEEVVDGKWDKHLVTMKSFWGSMALGLNTYEGRPMPKHMALKGLTPEHFATWLELFYQTLQDTAPSQAAEDYFIERAARIARGFQLNIFTYQPEAHDPGKSV